MSGDELPEMFDVFLRAARTIAGAGDQLALGVQHQNRRKALDLVLLGELIVLLLEFFRQLLLAREVQLDQNEFLRCFFLEDVLIEDFLLEPDAPAAPVRAGEVHQEQLVLRLGLGLGALEVGLPQACLITGEPGERQKRS